MYLQLKLRLFNCVGTKYSHVGLLLLNIQLKDTSICTRGPPRVLSGLTALNDEN